MTILLKKLKNKNKKKELGMCYSKCKVVKEHGREGVLFAVIHPYLNIFYYVTKFSDGNYILKF